MTKKIMELKAALSKFNLLLGLSFLFFFLKSSLFLVSLWLSLRSKLDLNLERVPNYHRKYFSASVFKNSPLINYN